MKQKKVFKPSIMDEDNEIRNEVNKLKEKTGMSKQHICRLIMKAGLANIDLDSFVDSLVV